MDRKEASAILKGLIPQFFVHTKIILDIAKLHFDDESFDRFNAITFEEPKMALPKQFISDFSTTVHSPPVMHKSFSVLPSTYVTDNCPIHTFFDSPTISRGSALKFCNKILNVILSHPLVPV
jgi:hypothetical protein